MFNHVKNQRNYKELYQYSKIISKECFLEAFSQGYGTEKVKLIEYFEKNGNNIKKRIILEKLSKTIFIIISFFYLLSSLQIFYENNLLQENISELQFSSSLFSISISIGVFFMIQISTSYMFTSKAIMGLFKVNTFKLLKISSVTEDEIKKIIIIVLIKSIDYQSIVMLLGFPIIIGIFSKSIFAVIIGICISMLNYIFFLSVTIYITDFLKNKIYSDSNLFYKIFYVLSILCLITVLFVILPIFAESLQQSFSQIYNPIIYFFFSFAFSIPFFSGLSLFPYEKIFFLQTLPIFIGFFVSCLIVLKLFKNAKTKLLSITKEKESQIKVVKANIEIKKSKPIISLVKKDINLINNNSVQIQYLVIYIITIFMLIFLLNTGNFNFINQIIYIAIFIYFLTIILEIGLIKENNEPYELNYILAIPPLLIYKGKRNLIFLMCEIPILIHCIMNLEFVVLIFSTLNLYYYVNISLLIYYQNLGAFKIRNNVILHEFRYNKEVSFSEEIITYLKQLFIGINCLIFLFFMFSLITWSGFIFVQYLFEIDILFRIVIFRSILYFFFLVGAVIFFHFFNQIIIKKKLEQFC